MSATQTKPAARNERLTDLERTLVLLKPDAVQRGLMGQILARFEDRGLAILGMKLMMMDESIAEKHYKDHIGKPFYADLVKYMTSGPILALCLEGVKAVAMVRKMMGATNPQDAMPGTIRGDFAQRMDANIIHGSDSPENGIRELGIFFQDGEILEFDPCHTHCI